MLSDIAHKAYNFAENGHIVEYKVAHFVVFGVQNEFAVTLEKALYGGAVVHKCYHNVAVVCRGLLFYNYFIPVQHSDFNHGITLDGQHEHFVGAEKFLGQGVYAFVILLGKDGLTCGYGTNQRNGYAVFVLGVTERNCTLFVARLFNKPLLVQTVYVLIRCGRGLYAAVGADFAYCGRKSVFFYVLFDEVINCLIFFIILSPDYSITYTFKNCKQTFIEKCLNFEIFYV